MGKIAVKRLTGSDLTLFEWQFRTIDKGSQKSINLNADVFIDQLYPSLPYTDVGRNGRIPLDLFLYGPGAAKAWNLQRKIIKGGTYKNWRLNGEYIPNPPESAERFNALAPGDFAIFDFEGDLYPTMARVVLVAAGLPEDSRLHAGIADSGVGSMRAIDVAHLATIVHLSGTLESHPVYELLLDAAIEDAAKGGLEGTKKLLARRTGRRLTRSELARARERADDVGRLGEELIDGHLGAEVAAGRIHGYEWLSDDNAIAPFDFRLHPAPEEHVKIEVKSTCGDFTQVIHFSIAEVIEMQASAERYDIYRVYELDERKAKLRVVENAKDFAAGILAHLSGLPAGVTVDSISVRPALMDFGEAIAIDLGLSDPPAPGELL